MKALTSSTAFALLFALGLGIGPAAAQTEQETEAVGTDVQEPYAGSAVCDRDGNGRVTEFEARECAEQGWTGWVEEEEPMTEARFQEAFPEAEDAETLFSEADADGDGEITRSEWMDWHQQAFAGAAQTEEGMPTSDYETWYEGGMTE